VLFMHGRCPGLSGDCMESGGPPLGKKVRYSRGAGKGYEQGCREGLSGAGQGFRKC
jgi:hypothetical protein